MLDLVFRAARVATPAGEQPATIGLEHGRIVAIAPLDAGLVAHRVVELADDEVLLPGLVDTHVHVNEPGRTEWEGFATRSASAGATATMRPPCTPTAAARSPSGVTTRAARNRRSSRPGSGGTARLQSRSRS